MLLEMLLKMLLVHVLVEGQHTLQRLVDHTEQALMEIRVTRIQGKDHPSNSTTPCTIPPPFQSTISIQTPLTCTGVFFFFLAAPTNPLLAPETGTLGAGMASLGRQETAAAQQRVAVVVVVVQVQRKMPPVVVPVPVCVFVGVALV